MKEHDDMTYLDRLVDERNELKERLNRLHVFNMKMEANDRANCRSDSPEINAKRLLMRDQEDAMTEYLHLLEVRMVIEGINID